MNSFITIELNSFLSEYIRKHTITGNPQLDQRLVMITVSFLATYTAIVLTFGKDFVKDKYNAYFNKVDFMKGNKDKIAHIKIHCSQDLYTYISKFLPKLELNYEKNIFSNNRYNYIDKNEISFCINADGNNNKKPWKLNNIEAKLPFEEKIDIGVSSDMREQYYIKFADRNINLCKFYHSKYDRFYWHLFIEKNNNNNMDDIYKIVDRFLTEAKENFYELNKSVKYAEIELYEIQSGEWKKIATLNKKSNETIVGQNCLDIFNDVEFFEQKLNKIYKDLDIPYKRGYLLYGPPGTGKTSIIKAIASYTKKSIYKITFNEEGLGDDDYKKLLVNTPINSIVLIEDADPRLLQEGGFIEKNVIIKSNAKDKEKDKDNNENIIEKKCRVSYNTVLDILDGVNPNSGRITFITTNHPNKLGKALLRAGRIDKKYKLDYANNKEIIEYFQMYYQYFKIDEKKIVKCANEFISNVRNHKNGGKITFAQLQQYLIQYLDDINKAIENIHKMFEVEHFEEYV